jgi:MFS transporter, MHS family, proline/betaine transporter
MTAPTPPDTLARTTRAASMGMVVETYDYAVYGFLAVVLAKNFFPGATPGVALLSALAVFGAAFVIRPVGGLIFGPLADRIGRRPTLVITLLGMAVVSTLIGLLPTAATIGVAAPILLVVLRLLQGLSAGGEYGTALIYAAEFAPPGKRGEVTSKVQSGTFVGLLLGALIVLGLNLALTPEAMLGWGWRIPFLLALPLGIVGLLLRNRLGETPAFEAVRDAQAPPVDRKLLRGLLLIGVGVLHTVGFYIAFTYVQTFSIGLGFAPATATAAIALALVVGVGMAIVGGRVSDRLGRRPTLLIGAGVILVASYLLVSGMTAASGFWSLALCVILLGAGPAFYSGVAPITYIELFPVHARGRGVALAYNLTVALFGGTCVYVCQWLVQLTGDNRAPAFVLMGAALVSGLAALGLRGVLAPREAAATPVAAP